MSALLLIGHEQRRARLAVRHRLAPGFFAGDVLDATRSFVALHGTDPVTIYLSARARVPGMTRADLEQALYIDRALIKHLAMRRTIFAFPREIVPAAIGAVGGRVSKDERRRLIMDVAAEGLHTDPEAWFGDATDAIREFLADGREASLQELREAIPLLVGSTTYGVGKSWGGQLAVAPRVLASMSAGGDVVRASNDGGWTASRHKWASMNSWLGHPVAQVSEADGTRALVELWLRAFGPGTDRDIKWWLGSTLSAVRLALSQLEAVEVDLVHGRAGNSTGFVLPDDTESVETVEPWAALLPALDPTVMGWFERDWYLGEYKQQLFDTAGNAGPTAWWNGRIVGSWAQSENGDVELQLLEDPGADGRGSLEREAAKLTEWFDGQRVLPRFPSPWAKTLAAGSP